MARHHVLCLLVVGALLVLSDPSFAQGSGQTPGGQPSSSAPPPSSEPEGVERGGYRIQQSIELGGRITDTNGSVPMYDTLVNLQGGPRVLEQSLSMQSLTNAGPFDTLTADTLGWGGDPSNAARLRVVKYRWYNFTASFRRDQNYFDYDLFANPLNPVPGSGTQVIVPDSAHAYYNTRRLYDFGLTLFPQRKFSFTFDFNRERMEGPSFSSVHEGTDALLFQPINTTMDGFRFGGTWRIDPHTSFNFTESIQSFKGDTSDGLTPFNTVPMSNGVPVEFGLPWFNSGSPCSTPIIAGKANPSCNGYLSYTRTQRVRTFIPTEQASFQSSTIKRLDIFANVSYSNADMSSPLAENFNGLITRTEERQINTNGANASANWISMLTDLGVTVHLTDNVRLVDSFRFRNYRVPGTFNLLGGSLFNDSTVAPPGSMLFPVVTFPGSTPLHGSGSPADLTNETFSRFLGQDTKENEIRLEYDITHFFGVHVGYRYNHFRDHNDWISVANADIFDPINPLRGNCAGGVINPDGTCTFTGEFDSEDDLTIINEHTALAGIWFRPSPNLRANFDAEAGYLDNFLTRIDPRHQQKYRGQISYTPHPWLTLGGNLNMLEARNHTGDINFGMHNRSVGANATVAPNLRFSFDLAYDYTAFLQNNNVCYAGTFQPAGSFTCVNDPTLMEILGKYNSHTHFGEFSVMFKPVDRVAMQLGYSVTNVDGSTLILNQLQPLGPLASRYQQPLASLEVGVAKDVTLHAGWSYYQYAEDSFVGPTLPRYFHANVTTLALKYAF